ncbi:MAG: DNA cytosine methyltransferase [Proteobacteria bacterium]|nr:DNA cytosine methyltransferase [Pseudomonadota bacterium]
MLACARVRIVRAAMMSQPSRLIQRSDIDGMTLKELRRRRGAHGRSLESVTRWDHVWSLLPSYAMEAQFPRWKRKFIRQNRDLYARNRDWIDEWLPSLEGLPASFQKLEWNCHGEYRQLSRYILQARPSGIRVKRPNWSPSLVALTTTQVPIIGWESRYLTLTECKRLQSMDQLKHLPIQTTKAYEALGNAVNVEVVTRIAERLLDGVGIATAGAEMQATHVVSPMPAR